MDIEPQNISIIQQDYLEFNPDMKILGDNVLVIGNPPFGRQSSLAIKFISKSAKYAKKIAFVLAKSFKKESMISKLDKHVFLVDVFDLPDNLFYFNQTKFDIPCSFFIFEVRNEEREPFKVYTTNDFTFLSSKENADNSIRRVGFYAGKIESLDVSESSHYFVKWNTENAKELFSKIKFIHNDTVGAKSISKNEMIKEYLHTKELENE